MKSPMFQEMDCSIWRKNIFVKGLESPCTGSFSAVPVRKGFPHQSEPQEGPSGKNTGSFMRVSVSDECSHRKPYTPWNVRASVKLEGEAAISCFMSVL